MLPASGLIFAALMLATPAVTQDSGTPMDGAYRLGQGDKVRFTAITICRGYGIPAARGTS